MKRQRAEWASRSRLVHDSPHQFRDAPDEQRIRFREGIRSFLMKESFARPGDQPGQWIGLRVVAGGRRELVYDC